MQSAVIAAAAGAERAGLELVARRAADGLCLARVNRLVDLGRIPDHRPVGDDLVAGTQQHEVVLHDLGGQDLLLASVAHHERGGRGQRDDVAQFAGRAYLLVGAHDHVDEHDDADEARVLQVVAAAVDEAEHHERADQAAQHHVEVGEDVGADDLEFAAGAAGVLVDKARIRGAGRPPQR